MKIIRRGILQEDKVYRITCSTCNTLFEFQGKEGKFHSSQYDGNYYTINCPLCGKVQYKDVDANYIDDGTDPY